MMQQLVLRCDSYQKGCKDTLKWEEFERHKTVKMQKAVPGGCLQNTGTGLSVWRCRLQVEVWPHCTEVFDRRASGPMCTKGCQVCALWWKFQGEYFGIMSNVILVIIIFHVHFHITITFMFMMPAVLTSCSLSPLSYCSSLGCWWGVAFGATLCSVSNYQCEMWIWEVWLWCDNAKSSSGWA